MRLPSRSVETSREAFDFHEKGIGFGRCPFRVSNSRSSLSVNTMREAASDTPGSPKTTVSARTGRGYRYAVTANTLTGPERDTTPDVTSERPRDGVNREGAIMPAEKFWPATAVEGDGGEPAIVVAWGDMTHGVHINGVHFDRSGLNRLIRVIRNARDRTYERDE